jgi:signal transduction histidine kinase
MKTPLSDRLASTPVLRGLVVGFTLVLLLLGVASFVAINGTRAIEDDTATLYREQLVAARLLNDLQAGHNTLAAVLHQLTNATGVAKQEQHLLADLRTADAALDRVARSAQTTPESARWQELQGAVRAFSADVRRAVNFKGPIPSDTLTSLFNDHDTVVALERELLAASERRIDSAERQIESESRKLALRSMVLLGSSLALSLLCAVVTVTYVRRSISDIEWHANELGRVSWHMLQSQESTARRFSHELHDELGQSLAAIKANLSADAQQWQARRADCLSLVDSAIANVRELSQLLRPVILDDFGLDAGLRWLSERFAERTGVRVDYASTFGGRLADETETHLFRIAQEAFTNIARHSGASSVRVRLEREGDSVVLSVEDNGRGLGAGDSGYSPSLGMTGMRARARQAGGQFQLTKPAGGGLRIENRVPTDLPQEAHVS